MDCFEAEEYTKSLEHQVEKLKNKCNDLRNELCQRCGRYKEAHIGACDDCKWGGD